MRFFRALGVTVLVLLALVLCALAAAWWWAGTEGSARWALDQVAKRQPLVAENVTGSLRTGVKADRLSWSQEGLQVEARQVELAWRPLALLQRSLELSRLHAAQVRVTDRRPDTGERPQPPDSLSLPLRVRVDDLRVGRFEWDGRTDVVLGELVAGYSFDGLRHRLALRNLSAWDGHYRGNVVLGAGSGFPLDAWLQGRISAPVPGAASALPLVFQANAQGQLARFELQAQVEGEPGSVALDATQARLNARITPFEPMPLVDANAEVQSFDAGALWPQAPHTSLSGKIAVQPQGTTTWTVSADLRNALPGPWDRRRVPAERVRLQGDWRLPGLALVRELDAQVGGGRVLARGQWEAEDAWRVEGTLTGVNPAAVHTAMAPLPLSGRATVRAQGTAFLFDTQLQATGSRTAPPRAGRSEIAATVAALELRSLKARGRWAGEELSLPQLEVSTADAKLDAALDLRLRARTGRGRADLEAPGMRVRAVGSVGPRTGGGTSRITVADIAQAQQWLTKLPGLPAGIGENLFAGRGDLQLAWQGGWDDPTVEGTLSLPQLQPVSDAGEGPPWAVRDVSARLDGRLADARLDLKAQLQQDARTLALTLDARGGRRSGDAWQGQVNQLEAVARDPAVGPGPWRLALRRPLGLLWAGGRFEAGASEAALIAPPPKPGGPTSQALVAWDPVRWARGELRTAGRITGLPMGWVELLGGPQLAGTALGGDLVFDGRWDAVLGDTARLQASLERSRGDLSVLAETGGGGTARVQAGVREARIALEGQGEAIAVTLRWDSERAGTADARLASRLARGSEGWSWPETAPLNGAVRAQLPRLGVWSLLAPPGWRLRGSLAADVAVAGTRGDPQLTGNLRADDLALRSVVDGVALQDGRMRARLEGRRLVVEELLLQGPGPDGGRVAGAGEGSWQRDGPQVRVSTTIDRLRASTRTDRQLTVSGQLVAGMDASGAQVRGGLRVDRARITLPDEAAPRLSDDVVVRNLPPGVTLGRDPQQPERGRDARPLEIAVNLDLGNDFRVQGRGIDTRLAGSLVVAGESVTEPRLTGVIRTVGGEYRAYGQRLEIDRGVIRFTGPVDNPALDVLAIRPRLTQRVGVQVTGTAQAPFVRLYAEPDLPEGEKLAWLVLGRPAASGGAETALLQSAALALVQGRGGGGGKGPAALLGLDELGFRRDGAEGPAVTLGKRLGRNLYASYERSLTGALGTLYVFYDLSQRFTLRAQAGERSAVDLIFTFAYD
jgi:translocation and assembly module TamB